MLSVRVRNKYQVCRRPVNNILFDKCPQIRLRKSLTNFTRVLYTVSYVNLRTGYAHDNDEAYEAAIVPEFGSMNPESTYMSYAADYP